MKRRKPLPWYRRVGVALDTTPMVLPIGHMVRAVLLSTGSIETRVLCEMLRHATPFPRGETPVLFLLVFFMLVVVVSMVSSDRLLSSLYGTLPQGCQGDGDLEVRRRRREFKLFQVRWSWVRLGWQF